MRTGSFIALAGLAALGLSGCASIDKAGLTSTASSSSTSDNATTSVDPDSATGSSTGTSTGQSNATGGTSFAFNDGGFTITGAAKTEVTVSNAGTGIGNEIASVAVNTGLNGMTWADSIDMALFRTTIGGVATDRLDRNQDFYNAPGANPNFTGYKEYRSIKGSNGNGGSATDAELQIWSYQYSNIGQYTVFNDPSAANNNNVSLFHDGSQTPTSGLPAGTATYRGKFGGVAVISNFLTSTRGVDDPFDTDAVAGTDLDPNGTWRVVGDVNVTANFGSGTVTGNVTNSTYRRFTGSATSPDGYITVTPQEYNPGGGANNSRIFADYNITGTITDSTYSGNVRGPNGAVVTGNNAVNGAFYGPNAEETAGVLSVETTSPGPSDGLTTNEENRRGSVKLRGVFQGTR